MRTIAALRWQRAAPRARIDAGARRLFRRTEVAPRVAARDPSQRSAMSAEMDAVLNVPARHLAERLGDVDEELRVCRDSRGDLQVCARRK